jgi:putative tricarboxylic transport membrane protein
MTMTSALLMLLSPWHLFLTATGVFLGIIVGVMPGINGAMLIALTLPLTYYMQPNDAMNLLVSMYTGSITGGLITATLLRIPGEPANIMTTFDGYPMAKGGEAGRALGLGIGAATFGSLFAWVALATLTRPLSELAVKFGPFDYFALVMTALVLIVSVSKGSMVKGLMSACLGALVAFPGVDQSTGQSRFVFGWWQMTSGLDVLPVLVGVFAIGTVLHDSMTPEEHAEGVSYKGGGLFMKLADWRDQFLNLIRSSAIGTWIGILPGIGAGVGALVSYTVARNVSKTPERFGKGSPHGIVASEAAANGTIGGALIPLIAMGIPGSVIDVFLMGAMQIHGIQPGPLLFQNQAGLVYTIIGSCLTSTIMMFVMMMTMIPLLRRVIDIPRPLVTILVLTFCVIGVFAANNRWFEVGVALAFGVLGFAMERGGFPLGPFVIAFILTPIAESKLRSGLMITDGDVWPLFTQPLSGMLMLIAVALFLWPLVRRGPKQAIPPETG